MSNDNFDISNSNAGDSDRNSHPDESRDQELAKLFRAAPIPDHRADFWSDLKANLGDSSHQVDPSESVDPRTESTTSIDFSDTDRAADILPFERPQQKRRFRPLLVAAAAITILAGGAAWISATNSETQNAVEAAGDGTTDDQDSASNQDEEAETESVDYSANIFSLNELGPGRFKAFSPDNEHIVFVELPDVNNSRCSDTSGLSLKSRNLATGETVPALGDKMIQSGGLELKILGPAEGSGRLNVAGTDFCDGDRATTWTGTMESDGQIVDRKDLESQEPGNDPGGTFRTRTFTSDPFNYSIFDSPLSAGESIVSPNGSYELRWLMEDATGSLEVIDDQDQRFILPLDGDLVPPYVAWNPTGDAIAVATALNGIEPETFIWDFANEEIVVSGLTTELVTNLGFDATGQLLALTTENDMIQIVNFGEQREFPDTASSPSPDEEVTDEPPAETPGSDDAPAAVDEPAADKPDDEETTTNEAIAGEPTTDGSEIEPARPDELLDCSGAKTPVGQLNTTGSTTAAATTAAKIDAAAATCDWAVFGTLINGEFSSNFGGEASLEFLKTGESFWEEGGIEQLSSMQALRQLLREPSYRSDGGSPGTGWPRLFSYTSCQEFTDEDYASMARLGYNQYAIDDDCESFGGYVGYRTAIADDGTWQFFVAGD